MNLRTIAFATLSTALASTLPLLAGDQLVSRQLNASTNYTGAYWDIGGDCTATITISATAIGSLSQDHGIRACLYKQDGTPVAWAEVPVGEQKTIQVSLTQGRYCFIFDLGVENPEDPIGTVQLFAEGALINPITGLPVTTRRSADLPPDPYYGQPSTIYLDGPIPFRLDEFVPVHGWGHSSETLIYLVDWV